MKAICLARRPLTLALSFALIAIPASAEAADLPARISGSVGNQSGYIGLREDIPDELAYDWYSATEASARAERAGETGRFYAALWTQFDAASGDWSLSLDEAWAEWTPEDFFAGKLGRFGVQFGPCLAFNSANSLVTKDTFDDRANKVGLDGISLEFRPLLIANKTDSPLSLALTAGVFLPGDASGETAPEAADIDQATAHGRITLFVPGVGILGPTELGLAGTIRRMDGSEPESGDRDEGESARDLGAWISADVGGFVLGAEGTVRTEEYGWAFSLNRKIGDYLAIIETRYESEPDAWQGFAQLSWITEDSGVTLNALYDFAVKAARTSLEASRNVTDFLVLEAKASWNYRPERWTPELLADYTAGVGFEYFF